VGRFLNYYSFLLKNLIFLCLDIEMDEKIFLARVAEQAERFEDMV